MYLIRQVTKDPKQKQTLILADGSSVALTIVYRPLQYGWFVDELAYGSFTLKGVRITNSPNMLHQFRNQIPFGFSCVSAAGREPMLIDDFYAGASKLYVLTADEVEEYAGYLRGG